MSEGFGIQQAVQRAQVQQTQAPAPVQASQQMAVHAPGLARVPLPPRPDGEERVKPRKGPAQMVPPRKQDGGLSPLSTGPLADAAAGAGAMGDAAPEVGERAARQGAAGTDQLPGKADAVIYGRTPRGDLVYLEKERWYGHIRQAHIVDAPVARGKRTTTWWPVLHSATGAQTMSEEQVLKVIGDAVSKGDWENAPRGTLLSRYDLPAEEARQFGVSEVAVSAAPDGRILSAYPKTGSNVLGVRELTPEEQAAASAPAPQQEKAFQSFVPQTTFG